MKIEQVQKILYTVKGHKGRFVFGYVEETPVVIMQGRVHYYEGYDMTDVVLPTRLMGMMGAKKILLTNAAGGCNPNYKPGDFMMITDHITTGIPSSLIGPNYETPAEVKLAQIWGGDAAGISKTELNHKEVQETVDKVAKSFKELVAKVVVNM